MAGLHDGFAGYRIATDAEIDRALGTSMVAVDANVLLNLYRWIETTSSDLLTVLERLGDRLWVPRQVVTEFWRGRLGAIATPNAAVREAKAQIEKSRAGTENAIRAWAKKASPATGDTERLLEQTAELFTGLVASIDRTLPAHMPLTTPCDEDPILRRLTTLLDGRVGEPLDADAWSAAVTEGLRRVSCGEPPGFRDAKKIDGDLPEGAAGDYLVWKETIEEARRRDSDLLLVTGDEKEDWWWKHHDEFLGPRLELVDEFHRLTERRLHLLRPSDLLARSGVLQVAVSRNSIEDAGRSWGPVTVPEPWHEEEAEASHAVDPWTAKGLHQLLLGLDLEGFPHSDVIREAASAGGHITRAHVYDVCGYPADRTLRGFTRPVARVTVALQHDGVVSPSVRPMLVPDYGTGVHARGFDIPPEVVGLLDGDTPVG